MSVERNLLISLLKLTKESGILIEDVKTDSKIASTVTEKLLVKLQSEGLIYLKSDCVEVDNDMRLKLAVKAAALGSDIEQISSFLCWQEFEEIAAFALKSFGYVVANNVRFKHGNRRWEIDVVGFRNPLVICIDCKHWQHAISPSALKKIVDSQVERTKSFADSLPNLSRNVVECTSWNKAKFVPVVLSLMPSASKFYDKVPIVPILQIQDFLNQLPLYSDSLRFFSKTFNRLTNNF
jgi:Holliday junction resolvase-like predicted endonuclease